MTVTSASPLWQHLASCFLCHTSRCCACQGVSPEGAARVRSALCSRPRGVEQQLDE